MRTAEIRELVEQQAQQAKKIKELAAEVMRLTHVLDKINALRNDVVGQQSAGISNLAYPLVAILDEAGLKGEGYEKARKRMRTIFDERDEALRVLTALWEHAEDRVDWFDGEEAVAKAAVRAPELVRLWKKHEAKESA